MRTLQGIVVAVLLVVAGSCAWFFLYKADLPDMSSLQQFAPAAPVVLSDPCLRGPITAIPAEQMGTNLRAAIRAAEPERSLSMQISRSMFCEPQRSLERLTGELRVDTHLRLRFSKEDLLTIYANRAWFGEGAVGVQNAAQHYFHKDAHDLTVPEAALLAALIRAPSYYSPIKHPARALERRNQVLEQMLAQGSLTAAEAKQAKEAPISSR